MFHSIPLVARRPKSGEPGTGKGKDKKADKKKDKSADPDKPDTPVPPSDPDEKVSKDNCTVERGQTAKLKKQLTKPQLKKTILMSSFFLTNCGGMTCDGLASRPRGVEILLAASCYRNRG